MNVLPSWLSAWNSLCWLIIFLYQIYINLSQNTLSILVSNLSFAYMKKFCPISRDSLTGHIGRHEVDIKRCMLCPSTLNPLYGLMSLK